MYKWIVVFCFFGLACRNNDGIDKIVVQQGDTSAKDSVAAITVTRMALLDLVSGISAQLSTKFNQQKLEEFFDSARRYYKIGVLASDAVVENPRELQVAITKGQDIGYDRVDLFPPGNILQVVDMEKKFGKREKGSGPIPMDEHTETFVVYANQPGRKPVTILVYCSADNRQAQAINRIVVRATK